MEQLIRTAESQLARLNVPMAVRLPGGRVLGAASGRRAGVFALAGLGLLAAGRSARSPKASSKTASASRAPCAT
jgi:hypothetical protein